MPSNPGTLLRRHIRRDGAKNDADNVSHATP
jgi:hypothetical protein